MLDERSAWAAKRLRERLEFFITILKQHADDQNKMSLLQNLELSRLKISLLPQRGVTQREPFSHPGPMHPRGMFHFVFGSLVPLRGIQKVEIRKEVILPEWFCQCLRLCILGKGGDPPALLEYLEVLVKKKTKLQEGMVVPQTTRA